jgi:hypothetical protein
MTRAIMTLAVLALSLAASCSSKAAELRVLDYCDLPGYRCGSLSSQPDELVGELQELSWCCSYEGGECSVVEFITLCDPEAEYAVICEWGRTVEQSSQTGTVDCFE